MIVIPRMSNRVVDSPNRPVRFPRPAINPVIRSRFFGQALVTLSSDFFQRRVDNGREVKIPGFSVFEDGTWDDTPRPSLYDVKQTKRQTPVNRIFLSSDNADRTLAPFLKAVVIAGSHANSPYGKDLYTQRVEQMLDQQLVGRDCIEKVYWLPVASGAGANKTAMAVFVEPTERAVCAETAHALFLEANAFAISTHTVPLTLKTMDGKIYMPKDPQGGYDMGNLYKKIFLHTWDAKLNPSLAMVANPSVLYITQPTEYGTLYSMKQIRALTDFAHQFGMVAYMDGARLWNAAAALGYKRISDYIVDTGVDAVSVNGTKNGMVFMDGLIILKRSEGPIARKFSSNPDFFSVILKKRRQLAERPAKESIQSAQMLTALEKTGNDREYGIEIADQSNKGAAYLEYKLRELGVSMPLSSKENGFRSYAQGTNMIYLDLPKAVHEKLAEKYDFYEFPIMNIDVNQDGTLDPGNEEKLWRFPRLAVGPSVTKDQLDGFIQDFTEIWRTSSHQETDAILS